VSDQAEIPGAPGWGQQARVAAVVVAAAALVTLVFVLFAWAVDEPFGYFSREPAEYFDGTRYVGWHAHLVAVVWWVGGICALTAGVALFRFTSRREATWFLLAGGTFTSVLVADDLFLLHEALNQRTGIHELFVFALYAVAMLAFLWRFRAAILAHDALLFVLSGAFLATSIGFDTLEHFVDGNFDLLEDGPKAIGVFLFSAFFARASLRELGAAITQTPSPVDRPRVLASPPDS
jgi:hypothetical protein